MSKMKKCQVVMLSTNEKAQDCLLLSKNSKDIFYKKGYFTQSYLTEIGRTAQHLYILSDDKIKVNDWCILLDDYNTVMSNAQQYNDTSKQVLNNGLRKIIATTNKSIILPQPFLQFIQKYVEEYNKGNIIKDVLVEYEQKQHFQPDKSKRENPLNGIYYEERPKVNPKDNTITIKKVKDSWNKEEVIKIVRDAMLFQDRKTEKHMLQYVTSETYTNCYVFADEWIEENL